MSKLHRGMVSAHDVAAYILAHHGAMSTMKLQKLVYYSQAWSLVWDNRPLFSERIEAWANGPVIPELFIRHRGHFLVADWEGNVLALDQEQRETVDSVVRFYGEKPAQWLSDLTHREAPWSQARRGFAPNERSTVVVTHDAMRKYYGSLENAK